MIRISPTLYRREGLQGQRRRQIADVLEAALAAVEPTAAVRAHLRREGPSLWVEDKKYDLASFARVFVVGTGKAGAPMAQAVEALVGDSIAEGVVNVKYGHVSPTRRITIHEAGHPIPDEAGVTGAREIAAILDKAEEDDLVVCLISGGGSALMPLPVEGVTLGDIGVLTDALLRVGANITEINTIRKHLDRLKGGRLARLAYPARVVSLILSDVVGNPLDVIASGPTVPDTSTFADACAILERYDLMSVVPRSIVNHLRLGARGEIEETPKGGDPAFERTQNVIVASNDMAARAAEHCARVAGFSTLVLSTYIEGEAREVAKVYAALAKEVVVSGRPVPRPACIIAGGETTVTLKGSGTGGRNQELALMAALSIQDLEGVAIACLATDGTDGPTDASGALADGTTVQRANDAGLDAWSHLANNDAYPFFATLNDLLITGPTNTNVNDLTCIFVW